MEGSVEVKLPTYGQMQQQLWEESEERDAEEKRSARAKSRNAVFFQCFAVQEGRKVGTLKGGCGPCGGMKNRNLHAAVARSTCRSQKLRAPGVRSTFDSCAPQKVHTPEA